MLVKNSFSTQYGTLLCDKDRKRNVAKDSLAATAARASYLTCHIVSDVGVGERIINQRDTFRVLLITSVSSSTGLTNHSFHSAPTPPNV